MSDDSQDKQHHATSKRLEDLRRKGKVMRSKDLVSGLVFIVGAMEMMYMASSFSKKMLDNFQLSFTSIQHVMSYHDNLSTIIRAFLLDNFMFIMPMLSVMLVVVLLSPFAFGGWNFTLEAIQFNFEKMNPISNIKSIFSPKKALGEIVKSIVKTTIIFSVLSFFVFQYKNELMDLIEYPSKVGIKTSYFIVKSFVGTLSVSVVFLVIFDVIYHYFQFQHQMKMTTQEVKDEHKEMEGSSEMKRKIRSTQFALIRQRLAQTVPKANVIVTNPTHYAIALCYEDRKDKAPKVIAKGKGATAAQIKTIAIANGIPIYEAPPLARAMFHTTKIGGEIHPALYMAVAIVLSYVHQLKAYQMGVGQLPNYVNEFDIPAEFVYHE